MSTPFFEVLCLLKVHLLPRFAERYLDEIGREDVQRMHIDRRMQGAAPG